jgi:hypothetical protein
VGGRGFHACNRLLDVHKSSITACVLLQQPSKPLRHIRHFGYTTGDLQLVAWLREVGVEHVAMESTGVYWKPVWNILEIIFKSCWRMHSTLRQLRDARQIPRTVSGSPNSCNMDSCAPAIYLQTRISSGSHRQSHWLGSGCDGSDGRYSIRKASMGLTFAASLAGYSR